MSWDAQKSVERIRGHLKSAPEIEQGVTLTEVQRARRMAREREDLDALSTRRAFLVEAAHIYGQLLDFGQFVAADGGETEGSHARVLSFLHDHYRLWDAIVDEEDSHRVDYHLARMHGLVTDPAGEPATQIERAVALAVKLTQASAEIAETYGHERGIRFGIDQGKCLAMTTGRSHDRDTLFLGAPANHAAKKAAENGGAGIFLADGALERIRREDTVRTDSGSVLLSERYMAHAAQQHPFEAIDREVAAIVAGRKKDLGETAFRFHRHRPPLSEVAFAQLSPSSSIRMGMACLFADIDGYTSYVDQAIRGGMGQIEAAVRTVHVIREELNNVLRDDFGGKRVRFIGDCIHGCLAAGEEKDDAGKAVEDTVMCASGMRSSFDLCLKAAEPGADLDLAVGIDYGPVPLTRIGMPGGDSVRCAAGRAALSAESVQQSLEGGGVRMGEGAMKAARSEVRMHYGEAREIIEYAAAADLLRSSKSPVARTVGRQPSARSHAID